MAASWRWGGVAAGLLGLAGCSLILDFGGDITDAGPTDDDGGSPTSDAADYCDFLEPNDNQAMANAIEAGTFNAAICPEGDRDWYSFSVNGAQDVVLEATFDNMGGTGDLDIYLYSESGAQLPPPGNGFGNVETIERTETSANGRLPAGNYAVEVRAFNDLLENDYELSLSIEPPGGTPDAGPSDGGVPDAGP